MCASTHKERRVRVTLAVARSLRKKTFIILIAEFQINFGIMNYL
jgi:hypothetical protein